jgi:RNA-directed DNA polymerase
VIEPIFEHEFEPRSFGFRHGLGCKDALREVDRHLKAGHFWVVDADLRGLELGRTCGPLTPPS